MIDNCGVYGENTVHLLSVLGTRKVKESKCFGMNENKKVNTFNKQVEFKAVEVDYEAVSDELAKAQTALDVLNNTEIMEITM